jgi:hypothetical protein
MRALAGPMVGQTVGCENEGSQQDRQPTSAPMSWPLTATEKLGKEFQRHRVSRGHGQCAVMLRVRCDISLRELYHALSGLDD